ncbi:DUF4469 domain-containing protein [Parabacteroides sp.]
MSEFEKDHYWEFTLRDNPLTKDNTKDCVAEVKTGPKTLRNEDIANEIKRTGSETKKATILSIGMQINEIILEALLNGDSVITDLCQFIPRITGPFENEDASFDPTINKLTFDVILTKPVREALAKVKPVKLGAKADVARISLVTDTFTGLFDGSITASEDIMITGSNIKVAGNDAEVGVFFVAADGTATKVTRRLTQNDPSKLIVRVPALADGSYTLRIVTSYNSGTQLLKNLRTLEYKNKLTIGKIDGGDDRPVIE